MPKRSEEHLEARRDSRFSTVPDARSRGTATRARRWRSSRRRSGSRAARSSTTTRASSTCSWRSRHGGRSADPRDLESSTGSRRAARDRRGEPGLARRLPRDTRAILRTDPALPRALEVTGTRELEQRHARPPRAAAGAGRDPGRPAAGADRPVRRPAHRRHRAADQRRLPGRRRAACSTSSGRDRTAEVACCDDEDGPLRRRGPASAPRDPAREGARAARRGDRPEPGRAGLRGRGRHRGRRLRGRRRPRSRRRGGSSPTGCSRSRPTGPCRSLAADRRGARPARASVAEAARLATNKVAMRDGPRGGAASRNRASPQCGRSTTRARRSRDRPARRAQAGRLGRPARALARALGRRARGPRSTAALAESQGGEAILERFHEGVEVNCLAVARGGEVTVLTLSDRRRPGGDGFGVCLAHVYPATHRRCRGGRGRARRGRVRARDRARRLRRLPAAPRLGATACGSSRSRRACRPG